jgi:hypothetical protein
MNRSRWAALSFVLATTIACFFGVRAELAQAQLSSAQHAARVATAVPAERVCGADPAGGC